MNRAIVILLLFFTDSVVGQTSYTKENLWLSFNGQLITEKYRFVLDGGNRTFNQFIYKNRTSLIRFSAAYKLCDNLFLGSGIANFYHFTYFDANSKITTELRPFAQFNFIKKTGGNEFRLRVRNEFRFWLNNNPLKNRARVLVGYLNEIKPKFKFPVVQYESFVTIDKSLFFENRFQVGAQYEINHVLGFLLYYMVQIQTNNPYIQNIIGLTLQYSKHSE